MTGSPMRSPWPAERVPEGRLPRRSVADDAIPARPGTPRRAHAIITAMRVDPPSGGLRDDRAAVASPFPPIGDYAFLSDCEATALVAPSGNVEWLCLPRMDSPSVFGAILDRDAGGFRLGPADMTVPAARRYLPGTMILETSWGTPTGWIIVRDALLIGPVAPRGRAARSPTAAPRPTTTPNTSCCARPLRERRGPAVPGLRARVRLRPRAAATWSYTATGYHAGHAARRRTAARRR